MTDGDNGPTEYFYLGSKLIAKESQVATTEDTPGYTGHLEDDDLQLTYMQQRYYDPLIGRFYSNDPVGFTASNPMMFNRYAYANNNPYRFVDPDGRKPGDLFETQEAAGRDAVTHVNEKSIKDNLEYGGTIDRVVSKDANGTEVVNYVASEPVQGNETGFSIDGDVKTLVGDYHTHGDYSKVSNGIIERTTRKNDEFDSDKFSSDDNRTGKIFSQATKKNREARNEKYIRVLGTPSGKIKVKEFE